MQKDTDIDLYKNFFLKNNDVKYLDYISNNIEILFIFQNFLSVESRGSNFVSALIQSIWPSLEEDASIKKAFEQQLITLILKVEKGPFIEFNINSFYTHRNKKNLKINNDCVLARARRLDWVFVRDLAATLEWALDMALDMDRWRVLERARARVRNLAQAWNLDIARDRSLERTLEWALTRIQNQVKDLPRTQNKTDSDNLWRLINSTPELYNPILDILCIVFETKPKSHWWEALRVGFLPKIPTRITLFNEAKWKQVEQAFEKGNFGETEIYSAAWQLIFDCWLFFIGYHNTREESTFEHLAQLTQNIDAPPIRIAHCIRDLAYGDESRADDLVAMVKSDDPRYREIFERCLWIPTAEEKKKEQASKKQKK